MDEWRRVLLGLTSTPEEATRWREYRYRNAFRLGDALVAADGDGPPISGHVVYGVYLAWGVLYVGQTSQAQRRLRDLPVGESHHLANTFPAEIWDRVVVVAWPNLPGARDAVERLGASRVGLALEYRLQSWARPLMNASRRTSAGGWRSVDLEGSKSAGAVAAAEVDALFDSVRSAWGAVLDDQRTNLPEPHIARCIRPSELL